MWNAGKSPRVQTFSKTADSTVLGYRLNLPLGEVWNINTGLYTTFYLNRETYQMYNVIQNILTKINI